VSTFTRAMKVARRVRRAAWGNGPRAIPAPRPRPTQPERAAVFCFDEKTQCQALDRTQPSLPMKPGRAGTMTHDYRRNGTIDLFAALNVATGEVLTDLRKGHAGADVLRFFKQIDAAVPRDLEAMSSWATCPPIPHRRSRNGWRTRTVADGTFISRPPRVPG
jgi:hypothetical protein